MAVVIEDMAMPKRCAECPCAQVYDYATTVIECWATGKMWYSDERPDWCPMHEEVHVVMAGELEDTHLIAVCSTKEKAVETMRNSQWDYQPWSEAMKVNG